MKIFTVRIPTRRHIRLRTAEADRFRERENFLATFRLAHTPALAKIGRSMYMCAIALNM